MTQALRRRIESELERALSWKEGQDPTPVLEALGYALTLEALDLRQLLSTAEARRLRRVGVKALAGHSPPPADGEDVEVAELAHRQIAAVAAAGLASVQGSGERMAPLHGMHPPSRTLVQMLHGEIDGLSAGRFAAHMVGCPSCQHEVGVLHDVSVDQADAGRLAIAAARPASVRQPAGGRVIAERKRPPVEAVLFEDEDCRRLAVYAQVSVPVGLVAEGVTTEESMAGYWQGRLDADAEHIEATVHLGDQSFDWKLILPSKKS